MVLQSKLKQSIEDFNEHFKQSDVPPPPPPRNREYPGHLKALSCLAAASAALLLLTACDQPVPPNQNNPTGKNGNTAYTTELSGTVKDSAGANIADAEVSASTAPGTAVKTKADGTFILQVSHPGTFSITVKKASYLPVTTPIIRTTSARHSAGVITLTSGKGGTAAVTYTTAVSGTVKDKELNIPLKNAEVFASTAPGTTVKTRPDGSFTLQVTHSGSFTLTVRKDFYQTLTTPGITAAAAPLTLSVIQLTPAPPQGAARFALTPDGCTSNCTLTIAEGVRIITQGEFAAVASNRNTTHPVDGTPIRMNSRLIGKLGTGTGTVTIPGPGTIPHYSLAVTRIVLPSSLVSIAELGFEGHWGVTQALTIPAEVRTIKAWAFQSLGKLGTGTPSAAVNLNVDFAAGSQLKTIEYGAFLESGIRTLGPLPESLETIGEQAFATTCIQSANFTIPGNVKRIGDNVFSNMRPGNINNFSGTLTIESEHLTRTPVDKSQTITGTLGLSLFSRSAGAAGPTGATPFSAVKLPQNVYDSYPLGELNVIFGTGAAYQKLNGQPHAPK